MCAKKKTKVAAVGDLHIHETDKGRYSELFKNISDNADILIIAGDLTDTGTISEAEVVLEELKNCKIPVVGVLGNHDHEAGQPDKLMKFFNENGLQMLDGGTAVFDNVAIAGIKGFGGGFQKYLLSNFGENMFKQFVQEAVNEELKLDKALARLEIEHEGLKKLVVMHYSPIPETLIGEPEQIFPFLGCSRLAVPVNQREVAAVFHGHAHIGVLEGKTSTGVPVYNVALQVLIKHGIDQKYLLLEI